MRLVETRADLLDVSQRLARVERAYLDTEFESTRSGVELCLVQIATGEEIFLIDAVRLNDLSPLAPALGDPGRPWVLHAGAQDVPLLRRALGLAAPPTVFDTQIAWALVSAEPAVALGYLLYRALGLRADKAHQADDWKRRPLPRSQLEYAAGDVAHLPALHAELSRRAEARGRLALVTAASTEPWSTPPEPPTPLALASFRHAWQLEPTAQAALRSLIAWCNELDPARDMVPDARAIFAVASRMPESVEALARIKGVPRRLGERGGALLWRLPPAARADTGDFVPIQPEPYATFAELGADAWVGLVRAEACAALEVAPEVAFPQRLARQASARVAATRDPLAVLEPIHGWRRELMADALRAAATRRPLPDSVTDAAR
jgi:ribonuclease D